MLLAVLFSKIESFPRSQVEAIERWSVVVRLRHEVVDNRERRGGQEDLSTGTVLQSHH